MARGRRRGAGGVRDSVVGWVGWGDEAGVGGAARTETVSEALGRARGAGGWVDWGDDAGIRGSARIETVSGALETVGSGERTAQRDGSTGAMMLG